MQLKGGEWGQQKPLPALDLDLDLDLDVNCAENCRGDYYVTERHHVSAQFKSKALGAFLPLPPLFTYMP